MSRRRIVVVNDDSIVRGGTAVLAMLSAKMLAARGHEVIWLCGDAGDNEELVAAGIEVIALGSRPLLRLSSREALVSGIHNQAAAQMVRDFIARRDTPETVYHVHSWAQIFSPALFPALAPVAARTVLHAHDSFLACPNGFFMDYQAGVACKRVPNSFDCITTNCDKRSYAQKLWRVTREARVHRALGDLSDWGGIITIHPSMEPQIARAGYRPDRIRTVRNPVVPFTETRIEAEKNRALLYVGRIEADKGIGDLAAAARRTEAPMIVLGEGSLRQEIAARNADAVLPGWVGKSDIGPYAAQARALVLPTHHPEPFGLVIAEASASGLPVLVSKTAEMASEVEARGLGFAFDVFDPDSFDAALRRIVDMPEAELRAMSARGFARDLPLGNTPEGWIDALEGEYDRLLTVLIAA